MVMGYVFIALRDLVPIKLITIIAANCLIVLGPICIYVGIMRFLNKEENRSVIVSVFVVFLLSFFYYTYFDDNITLRTVIVYAVAGFFSLLTVQSLFLYKTRLITTSAYFNALLLLINGCFFAFRAVETLTIDPVHALFTPTMMQTVSFLVLFIYGILLTFGLVIMVNQRLNAEMREAKENSEKIFNTSPDAVLVTRSSDGIIVDINDGFTVMTGYARDEVMGKSSLEVSLWKNPADRGQVATALNERGFCSNVEADFLRKDGSPFTAMISAKIITLQGAPHIISVTRDITERKQAEIYREMSRETLQILNEPGDLRESVQRVVAALKTRTGFDAVGIRLQDGEDFPYFVAQGFSQDFLLTENTLIERAADGGMCRNIDGKVSLECTCGLVISGKTDPANPLFTAGGSVWTNDSLPFLDIPIGEDPRHHPRNQCIHKGYASIALVPIGKKDRIVGLIQFNDRRKGCFTLESVELLEVIASHISSALMRKQAEAEKEKLEAQNLQLQKSESLSRMAGSIAHIFNNQLGVIIGNLELAMMALPLAARQQTNLTSAMTASKKAAEISGLMLTYLGQLFDKREPLDFSEVIRQNIPALQASMPENVVLESNLPSRGPVLKTNADYVKQILTNIITNAWEAVGKNSGTISMVIKTVSSADIQAAQRFPLDWQPKDNTYACLEVTDTGSGIEDNDIEKLFDPFFSTKFTGRGMGLAVVLGLVRVHNGVITVESIPNRGSKFRVYLPVCENEVIT